MKKSEITSYSSLTGGNIKHLQNQRPSRKDTSNMTDEEKALFEELFNLRLAQFSLNRNSGTPEGDKEIEKNIERKKVVQRRIAQIKSEKERGR